MSTKCPYPDCKKKIRQMIMLIDNTRIPRETYYACPHCKNRIDLIFKRGSLKFSSHPQKNQKGIGITKVADRLIDKVTKDLHDFMAELEGQRGKKLTDKETTDSIKIVKAVISSLQAALPRDEQDGACASTGW